MRRRTAPSVLVLFAVVLTGCTAHQHKTSPPTFPQLVNLSTGYQATIGGACATTPDGRVLMYTFGPAGLDKAAFPLTRAEQWESRDNGRSWDGPRVLHRGTRDLVMLPTSVLRLHSGKLLLLLCNDGGYDYEHHTPDRSLLEFYTQTSGDNGKTWSTPKRVDATWQYVNSPLAILQLKNGRILIPSGYLKIGTDLSVVSAIYSDDEGKTWKRSPSILEVDGEGWESGPAEPTAVELPDGRVWMLMRTQTGVQWESFSSDGGATWTKPQPSRFTSSSAPATFTKLRDGRIVITWSNSVGAAYARHCLAAAISDDGGKTFRGFRELAKVEYPLSSLEKRWGVAYSFPCEAADGTLLVPFNTGDWQRMNLRVARVDPNWLEQSSLVDDFSNGMADWCDVSANAGNTPGAATGGEPGLELSIGWVAPGPSGITRNVPLVRRGTVSLTVTPRKGTNYVLLHNTFLDPGKFEDACVRVRFDASAGKSYVGSGTPTKRTTSKANFTPDYSYTAYPVKDEVEYPDRVEAEKQCVVTVRIDASAGKTWVRVNNGPEIERALDKSIEGICYIGAAVAENGKMRLRRVESGRD
jgi:hypothetical protein